MSSENNFIQKAFDLTKDNIILAQPLIIFLVIISITLAGLAQQKNHIAYFVFLVSNILLTTAFFSGWFFMIKEAALNTKKEFENQQKKAEASMGLLGKFFPGVGEYFLPVTFTIAVYFTVYLLLIFAAFEVGTKFLADPNLDFQKIVALSNSGPAEMQKYVYSLSVAQIKTLNYWILYIFSALSVFSFLTMFWFPAIFDKNKEGKKDFILYAPFLAFNRNIVFLFKNFFPALGLLIFLFFMNFILSLLGLFFNLNIVLSIVGMIISFYFMTYAVVLIFLYYEEKH